MMCCYLHKYSENSLTRWKVVIGVKFKSVERFHRNLSSIPAVCLVTWCIVFQELKESFNYGLFCPPVNGKAGKFLDEERRLGDYPFNGPVGYLEVSSLFVPSC